MSETKPTRFKVVFGDDWQVFAIASEGQDISDFEKIGQDSSETYLIYGAKASKKSHYPCNFAEFGETLTSHVEAGDQFYFTYNPEK